MKWSISIFLLSIFFAFSPTFVSAQVREQIDVFDVQVEIQETGILQVTERIVYDFGENRRHGIFREIPKSYFAPSGGEKEQEYKLLLSDFVVTSRTAPDQFSREGGSEKYRLRIGDPDTLIDGAHTYTITYTAKNAISFYENFDEIYWNATGNSWDVPINSARLEIILPENVPRDDLRVACYQGPSGSTESCADSTLETASSSQVTTALFEAKDLESGEGLTGALGFPKGVVPETRRELAGPGVLSFLGTLVLYVTFGLLTLLVLGLAYFFWRKYGKDPKGRGVVVRQYEPQKDLSPLETGFIVDEKIDSHDITAEIVYLAQQGYLHILAIPSKILFLKTGANYYFLKQEKETTDLKNHQREILDGLFKSKYTLSQEEQTELLKKIGENDDIQIDRHELKEKVEKSLEVTPAKSLQQTFYADLKKIKRGLHKDMTERGFFAGNPRKRRQKFDIFLGVFPVLFFFGMPFLFQANNFIPYQILVVSGVFLVVLYIVGLVLRFAMTKRTEKGVDAKEHALGLKQYLSVAEKRRLDYHFDPRENPALFERLLPFAIALKVDEQWAKELDDIQIAPEWYIDAGTNTFTVASLSNSMSDFSTAASSSYAAPGSSGSGGGGVSGGGAGGGGGGSW